MPVARIDDTWNIPGPTFLWAYLGLGALLAAGVWLCRRGIGPPAAGAGALDAYDVALLNGGPALAITAATATLRQLGLIVPGGTPRTLRAAPAERTRRADALERAVYDAVARTPDVATRTLEAELADSPALADRRARL
ncbi:MAG TPA: TIGR04222 domain-containing membrane protein, partial [Solirubrobacteraceae bacterium]|nr:TIGR04222 domain-containing membrane protein [Solirubrobacteraceae bacterium]